MIPRNHTGPADDLVSLTAELDVNLAGPIRMVSVLIDRLKANRGTIINVSSGLAFVPLQLSPIYCATKAALHSYTISLRQQLKDEGVEVIELMPPAVHTELTADMPEDGDFKILTTAQLMEETFKGLRAGRLEIRPGQANQLYWMSTNRPRLHQRPARKGLQVDGAAAWTRTKRSPLKRNGPQAFARGPPSVSSEELTSSIRCGTRRGGSSPALPWTWRPVRAASSARSPVQPGVTC